MEVHSMRSEYREAAEIAGETLRIAPDDNQARSYLDLLRNVPAESNSGTPEEYLELSLRYYRAALYEKCVEAALEALRLKPDYDLAYNNICAACNSMGKWDEAIKAGEKAVELNPANGLARNNLAWAKMKKDSAR
jgi:tetratricopeptide (TPR) repeat protein